MLYIVSTPIGNLGDITFRAIETLKSVDLIVAEDTRHVRKLLNHYDIKTAVDSYHSYSDNSKVQKILHLLEQGKEIALVSDAGTPGISDPGYRLINEAINSGIRIVPIPGASAALAALVGAGLAMDKFVYLGFLPVKKGRQSLFKELQDEARTMVIYESPHRLIRTLEDLVLYFGENRRIVIARELTKIYEEFVRGTTTEVLDHFKKHSPKGEFVILLAGN